MTTKFPKEVSQFIQAVGAMADGYFWFPMYFKKVGEDLFEVCTFKELPNRLQHIVEQSEPREQAQMTVGFSTIRIRGVEGATKEIASLEISKINNVDGDERITITPIATNKIEIR